MEEETRITAAEGAAVSSALPAAIAGRYVVRGVLGSGGFGAVYRAEDLTSRESVAIKIVGGLSDASRRRLRRELAALRWLQMPGVVRLRDDGPLDGGWFIVMDVVEGAPFPAGRASWDALRPVVADLLEVLGRVHAAGVVHRDLKPANVLVDADGRVTLLDFGIARGRAVATAEGVEFTRRYAAPEQVAGEDGDARTDLYAVGKMIAEAAHELPGPVARLVGRMTMADPARRPADVAAVGRYLCLTLFRPF